MDGSSRFDAGVPIDAAPDRLDADAAAVRIDANLADADVADAAPDGSEGCVSCIAPAGCRYETASCADCGPLSCQQVCGTGPACGPTEYCDLQARGTCEGRAMCRARPLSCTDELVPVCGCDAVPYRNECLAFAGGTDISYDGPCDCRRDPCASGLECVEERSLDFGFVWVCR